MLKWFVVGYFSILVILIKFMFFSRARPPQTKTQIQPKFTLKLRKIDRNHEAISKAIYNQKEFRRPRD